MSLLQSLKESLQRGVVPVLLVDDDLNITSGLRDILEDSGYTVEVAHSLEDAVDLMNRLPFAVMVSDYSLPDGNGMQLAQLGRARYPWLEIILMTGHDRVEVQSSDAMGVNYAAFLRKPVDVQAITHTIETVVEKLHSALGLERVHPAADARAHRPYYDPPSPLPRMTATSSRAEPAPAVLPPPAAPPASFVWPALPPWSWLVACGTGGFLLGWLAHHAVSHNPAPVAAVSSAPASSAPVQAAFAPSLSSAAAVVDVNPSSFTVVDVSLDGASERPIAPAPRTVEAPRRKQPEAAAAHRATAHASVEAEMVPKLASDDLSVRLAAAKALLRQNAEDPRATAVILDLLRHAEAGQRRAAAEACSVARVRDAEIIKALGNALSDTDPSVAYAAAVALRHSGKSAGLVLPQLATALGYRVSGLDTIADAAKEALQGLGASAIPGLIEGLKVHEARPDLIDLLKQLGPEAKEAVPALEALRDDRQIGEAASEALTHIAPTPTSTSQTTAPPAP